MLTNVGRDGIVFWQYIPRGVDEHVCVLGIGRNVYVGKPFCFKGKLFLAYKQTGGVNVQFFNECKYIINDTARY